MNELIKIERREIGASVSARTLYIGLGLDQTHWARWSRENIEQNHFFLQSIDFIQLAIMATPETPKPPKDYAVSIEFAKHIAMQARTARSHEYRQYMIDCENKSKALTLPDFTNPVEAARAWADAKESEQKAIEENKVLQLTITNQADLIRASNEASIKAGEILVREFVKANDIIDIGQNKFFEWMREQGYIMEHNEPYQPFVTKGYLTWKPTEETHGGKFRYTLRITPRGALWLATRYMIYRNRMDFEDEPLSV